MSGLFYLIAGCLMIGGGLWGFVNHLKYDQVFQYYKRMFMLTLDVVIGLGLITLWA